MTRPIRSLLGIGRKKTIGNTPEIRDKINDFLNRKPNCKKLLSDIAKKRFPNSKDPIAKFLSSVPLVDLRKQPVRPGDEGVSGRGTKGKDVKLFPKFDEPGPVSQGNVAFHETLHYLYGGHQAVVKELKIDVNYPSIPEQKGTGFFKLKPYTQEQWERKQKKDLGYDGIAAIALNNWLENNCKNKK